MRQSLLRPALLILVAAAGCDSILDVDPINEISEEQAITSPASAHAALAGLYDALQDDSYYGGELFFFGDLSGDDVQHTGTFTTYRQIDQNDITSDNGSVETFWDALYAAVGRANIIIARVPGVPGLDDAERDRILGEAHLIRALTYHNLVKFWGEPAGMGVPLVLVPPADVPSASNVTRASTAEVYTQIVADLQQAESLLVAAGEPTGTPGLVGVARAIRARVFLYQGNYAGAEAEAEVVAVMGYALAPAYADLFGADATDEDIFRLDFDPVDFNYLGYYYRHSEEGGRREITPSDTLARAYDPAYDPTNPVVNYSPVDARGQHNIAFYDATDVTSIYGSKWATGVGDDDLHLIRFAEVLLIQAEAEARQNKLGEAEATLTPLRVRAGLAAAGLDTMAQAAAITAILQERRLELAYEGDRWPDLVRTGLAVTTLGIPAYQMLYPIPLNERDVTDPPLPQNPGY